MAYLLTGLRVFVSPILAALLVVCAYYFLEGHRITGPNIIILFWGVFWIIVSSPKYLKSYLTSYFLLTSGLASEKLAISNYNFFFSLFSKKSFLFYLDPVYSHRELNHLHFIDSFAPCQAFTIVSHFWNLCQDVNLTETCWDVDWKLVALPWFKYCLFSITRQRPCSQPISFSN